MQAYANGPDALVGAGGDLGSRQTADVVEHDRLALQGGQAGESVVDGPETLARLERIVARKTPIEPVEGTSRARVSRSRIFARFAMIAENQAPKRSGSRSSRRPR